MESFAEKNDIQDMTVKELEDKIKALKQEKEDQSVEMEKEILELLRSGWKGKTMKRNVWPGNWKV